MNLKPLLLSSCVAIAVSACNSLPQTTTSQSSLIAPYAKGQLDQFSGATRLTAERSEALKASISPRHVKHVILFIGDGTSDSEITIARNYVEGAGGCFKGIDVLPFTGSYTTYSVNKDKTIDYVTDSAASASAWAMGIKTYNGAIGVDVQTKAHESILALAKRAGYATGNVTTTELQDATPAALIAHVTHRKCYSPSSTAKLCPTNALENGGLGSISEQLLDARADVTLGGGATSFNEMATAGQYKGQTLLAQAQTRGYKVVSNADQLGQLSTANQQQPVLGLFAQGNLPVSWIGPKAVLNGNKQAAQRCQINPARGADVPSLRMMTAKAIQLLEKNPKGFFLQVESGSIDKQNHAADPCGQIGETVALDEAVQEALAFAKTHPDTLIIVTGDHAHTSQIIPVDADSPGKTANLLTKDQSPMAVNYATSTGNSQEHTGAQVRIAAYGPRAANVSGLIDQTDLFFIMRDALNIH
ncbi:alkaline phosphatase [Acinetobacter sp. ANC 3791]|uniref:alkaline phosphatase n=1 Tax=Acinetobacter sp. ANC 3791 TaxID=2529836 RepID=UPI00103D09C8|nr:alkaline phosphatase [Acinetobacter sp. ANC 3791]TCB86508.1 alkaline phosphatase [Acinetobacter sp. ANC 3791]